MKKLIEVKGLTFGYTEIPVLEDVNLDIFEKDYILAVGPNGGGKTTLLKLILGIIEPWSGTVRFDPAAYGRVGYVPQYSSLNKNFPVTVSELVLMGTIDGHNFLRKHTRREKEEVRLVLEKVGLFSKENEHINNLSGGQIQRALIARALVSAPLVLLLDEPTASIDITSQKNLRDFLHELNEKITIVVVTHDPTPFAQVYKHITCINRKLFYHGRGELDAHTLEKTYGCPVELLGHGIPHTILKHHHDD